MAFRSRWLLRSLLTVSVSVAVGNAWAMRAQDESAAKAKPGVVPDPAAVTKAIQNAPADYAAWKARNAFPAGKTRLNRSVQAASLAAPTGQASLVTNLKAAMPDLEVRFDPTTGAASFIKSRQLQTGGGRQTAMLVGPPTAGNAAIDCLHQYRSLLKVKSAYQEFTPKDSHTDELGLTHFKYQQMYKGLPVWGKEVWVHVDAQNAPYLVEGKVQPTPTVDIQPRLTADQAIAKAQQDMTGITAPTATLMIYVDDLNVSHLAWQVTATKGCERWHWFIDAAYGGILRRFSDTRYEAVAGSGVDLSGKTQSFETWHQNNTYNLVDTTLPMHGTDPDLPGSLGSGNLAILDAGGQDPNSDISGLPFSSSSPAANWDPAGVSAINNFIIITEYYKNTHNRNGIDNGTLNTISFVHVGQSWGNACWTGQVILIGDGDNQVFKNLAGGLDVLAHEYTHAVIDYTANFEYQYQSGALHEGIADIFGCMVDRANWTVGETVTISGKGLRDLSNPHNDLDGPDPATMDEYQNLPYSEDYGGVHINATIIGHAAYLMAEGLSNSITRDKTEKVFYRAITTHMTSQSTFADCRNATIQTPRSSYGANSAEVQGVTAAWDTVKVSASTSGGGSGGGGGTAPPATGPDTLVFIYYDTSGAAFLGLHTSTGDEYQVTPTQISQVRPVITTGGTEVLFVDASNDLCVASLNPNDTYQNTLINDGSIRTIGGSQDGRYFAFTDTSLNNKLYVLDLLNSDNNKTFDLYLPSVDGGQTTSLLDYADVLDFDISNQHVIFDALSRFNLSGSSSTTNTQNFWSVGILDISTGQISNLVPVQAPGVDVGNPSAANTRDWIIAIDVKDANAGTCQSRAINTINGKTGLLSQDAPDTNYGYPSFNGDDTLVAVDYQSGIYKVPVTGHKDGSVTGDPTQRTQITSAAYYPRYYRTGQNGSSPKITLSVSSLDFGQLAVNSTLDKTVTVANTGGGPLTISGFSLSDSSQFQDDGGPITLDPGYETDVTVTFAPAATGSQSATLTIASDDPTSPQVSVQLTGEGTPASSGGNGSGTTPSGPCFIATAAYGSYLDPHVASLRQFRDQHLLTNAPGRAFVAAYYRFSPPVAAAIAQHETLRTATRWTLTPLVLAVQYPEPVLLGLLLATSGLIVIHYRRKAARRAVQTGRGSDAGPA